MKEIGSTISSTDTDVKLGTRAKSNSKANTTKGKRTEKEGMSGLTEVIMKVISWTAFSKAQVCGIFG